MAVATIPKLTPVTGSSQIKAVAPDGDALVVEFHSAEGSPRSVYRYAPHPENGSPARHAEGIGKAESAGRYFNQHIRGRFPLEKLSMEE